MSLMLDEIRQQPEVVRKVLHANRGALAAICRAVQEHDIRFALLAARGTSDNAALIGKYILGYVNGMPTGLIAPSLFTLYKSPFKLRGTIVIGISQSGESPDIVEVMRQAKRQGAYCVAVTNEKNSDIVRHADETLYCSAGKERSVPATKTYTATLLTLYQLAFHLAGRDKDLRSLQEVPHQMDKALAQDSLIRERIERYRFANRCIVLGRGLSYATALETALKIKETNYVEAEAFSGADFMHGPIAIADESLPAIVVAPPDATLASMRTLCHDLKSRGVELIVISSNQSILSLGDLAVPMPVVGGILSPLSYIIPGQLFACHLAETRGYNPDKPRGLHKVTKTL